MDRLTLVSPVDVRAADAVSLAERRSDLSGCRLGLLDNRKGNANVLLARLGEKLRREYAAASVHWEEKPIISRPATDEQLDRLVENCDAVITAIGD